MISDQTTRKISSELLPAICLTGVALFLSGCVAEYRTPEHKRTLLYERTMTRSEGFRMLKAATLGNEVAYLRRGTAWINFGMFERKRSVVPNWEAVAPLRPSDEFIHTHPDSPFPSLADVIQYFDCGVANMLHTVRHPYGCTSFSLPDVSRESELFVSKIYSPENLYFEFQLRGESKEPAKALQEIIPSLNKRLEGRMILSFEESD